MPISRRLFAGTGLAFLAAGFVLLVLIAGSSAWLVERNRSDNQWISHTETVRAAIFDFGRLLDQAEGAQRGFLLTGDPTYLDPYGAAHDTLLHRLDDLVALTSDNPSAQERLARLRTVTADRMARLDEAIAVARSDHAGDAAALVRKNGGRELMTQARGILGDMSDSEQALLQQRRDDGAASATMLFAVSLVGSLVIAGLAIASIWLVARYTKELREAQQLLADSNATLEDTVRARTAELEQANDEIQRFAYIVSHDLRSPLVNVMGFTSELETAAGVIRGHLDKAEAALDPDVQEAVSTDLPEAIGFIRTSTDKMDRLIGAILKLSREGRRVFAPERIAMHDFVETVAGSLQHQLETAHAEIIIGTLPDIVSDRLAVEQVFGNLLDNAVKYLAPDHPGRIEVRGRERIGGLVVFEIADNGRGIDPKDHERIFELFRRSGVQDTRGEGIGLAYVRTIVRRLGGSIECDSMLGRGTTFRITLPKALSTSRQEAA